jgi:glutamine synthetase
MYYCSVGGKNTHGRQLVEEEHADLCIAAGINFEGNQEVACGQ